MTDEEKKLINSTDNYYEIEFERIGGLVMPVIYEIQYEDGSAEVIRIPAEIWRKGDTKVTRVHATSKTISKIVLDPFLETADTDTENNYFPREEQMNKFEVFKRRNMPTPENPMQKEERAKKVIKP